VTRLPVLAFASFALGVVLMIPFELWITRLLGVLAMFVAVVAGVFAIATPDLLGDDDASAAGDDQ
jgi:hypothetical protein